MTPEALPGRAGPRGPLPGLWGAGGRVECTGTSWAARQPRLSPVRPAAGTVWDTAGHSASSCCRRQARSHARSRPGPCTALRDTSDTQGSSLGTPPQCTPVVSSACRPAAPAVRCPGPSWSRHALICSDRCLTLAVCPPPCSGLSLLEMTALRESTAAVGRPRRVGRGAELLGPELVAPRKRRHYVLEASASLPAGTVRPVAPRRHLRRLPVPGPVPSTGMVLG